MHTLSIKAINESLSNKSFSSTELCQYYLNRIKRYNTKINAFISINEDQALKQAAIADMHFSKGTAKALTGIPLAHKDLFCTKGTKTTCASKMLDNFISPYNATLIEKLQNQGAISLGKTNMDEFAMGSSNSTSYYGAVKNPWNTDYVPGGSSGGSAAALAAKLCVAATGTDTGGSIRQPAAFCGLTGIKPTYGSISRYGMIAFASSLDQAGPMAQSAEDAAILLENMVGHDSKDSTSITHPNPEFSKELNKSLKGLKIGLPKEYFSKDLNPEIANQVHNSAKQLEKLGATLIEVSLAKTKLSVPCYYIIAPAEASSNLSRYDGLRFGHRAKNATDLNSLYCKSRSEGFGREVQRRIMLGTFVLSSGYFDAYYVKAQKIRRMIRDEFTEVFKEVDLILSPTTPTPAFKADSNIQKDPVQMYLNDLYTIPANLAGLPALSMPCGFYNHLPIGTQLIGPHFNEGLLLNVAHQYQMSTDFHKQMSPDFIGDAR